MVGKSGGSLYLGAGFDGIRLNKLYKQAITHDEIISNLKPILESYSNERLENEKFEIFASESSLWNQQMLVLTSMNSQFSFARDISY